MSDAVFTISDGIRAVPIPVRYDADGFFMGDLKLPVPMTEDTYAQGVDADHERRIRSQPKNAPGSGTITICSPTSAGFWDHLDNLQDIFASTHRRKGTITWTPPDGAALIYDIEACGIDDFPTDRLLAVRVATISWQFNARPYARLTPVTVFSGVTFDGPIDGIEIEGIEGHADALAELTLTDASATSRAHIEVCLEQDGYDSVNPRPLEIGAADLVTEGYGGELATLAGSYSAQVVEASLLTTPVALCGTGPQEHIGLKKVRVRVYPSSARQSYRLVWRTGEGAWEYEGWVTPPGDGDFFDLPLATIDIEQVPEGTHSWEGIIESVAEEIGDLARVDAVWVLPAQVYGRFRGTAVAAPSGGGLAAADDLSGHATGTMVGKVAPTGGTWGEAGDTDDFQSNASLGIAERAALSDADLNTGQYLRLGSGVIAGTDATLDIGLKKRASNSVTARQGHFVRYVDPNNWLLACYESDLTSGGSKKLSQQWRACLYKRTGGGTPVLLGSGSIIVIGTSSYTWKTLRVTVDEDGEASLYELDVLAFAPVTDAALATGGALDDGGFGLYDAYVSASAATRGYRNYRVLETAAAFPLLLPALNAGQSMKVFHDKALTENAGGTAWGRTPIPDGAYLKIPPATRNEYVSRLVVKIRDEDVDEGYPDGGLTRDVTGELIVTPRVQLAGKP